MKFQNPSLILFLNGTHGRTHKRMHARTDKPNAICSHFFKVWGHNKNRNCPLRVGFFWDQLSYQARFYAIYKQIMYNLSVKQRNLQFYLDHSYFGPDFQMLLADNI